MLKYFLIIIILKILEGSLEMINIKRDFKNQFYFLLATQIIQDGLFHVRTI